MKSGKVRMLAKLTAAVLAAATVITAPGAAPSLQACSGASMASPAFVQTAYAAGKKTKLKYYSAKHYDKASLEMIKAILRPTVITLKERAKVRKYHYKNDTDIYKDAATMYLIKAESMNKYDWGGHVCEDFARDLEHYVKHAWVEGKPVGNVTYATADKTDHAWDHIVLDGKEYNLEPQDGIVFFGRKNNFPADRHLKYAACKAKSFNTKARLYKDFLDDVIEDEVDKYGDHDTAYYNNGVYGSQCFVLNPLLVLKGRHPELFADRAVFKEFVTHNPEVRVWQSAWYSHKYGNDHASDKKIDAMIKGTKVEVKTVTPNVSIAEAKESLYWDLHQFDFIYEDEVEEEDDDYDYEPGDYFDPEESILTHVDNDGNETCYASDGVNKWYLEGVTCLASDGITARRAFIATNYSDVYFPKHTKNEAKFLSEGPSLNAWGGGNTWFSIDPVITIPAHKKDK